MTLSAPMRDLLWTMAQHKYGWAYCGNAGRERRLQVADALERRGLVAVGDRGSHYPHASATDAGFRLISALFPVSPFVLGTYDWALARELFGHWTPREGVSA